MFSKLYNKCQTSEEVNIVDYAMQKKVQRLLWHFNFSVE